MPTRATSFATGLILGATSFSLGVIYTNWAYDYNTLWTHQARQDLYELSLRHYQTLGSIPKFLAHVHHFIIGLGLLGIFIKLYKPSESNKLFDGGTLILYVIAISLYVSNIIVGIRSAIARNWGDVDENTGINVIAASQVFIVLVLLGVFVLQIGQYWAEKDEASSVAEAEEQSNNNNKKKKKD